MFDNFYYYISLLTIFLVCQLKEYYW